MAIGCLFAWLALGAARPPAFAETPPVYVQDDRSLLEAGAKAAIETILREHDQLTGERILVAILAEDARDPAAAGREFYQRRLQAERGKAGLGAALVVAGPRGKAVIEAGIGLESLLDEGVRNTIIEGILAPGLRSGSAGGAVAAAVVEMLRTLDSPLVTNRRAQDILEAAAISGSRGASTTAGNWVLAILLAAGLAALALAVMAVGGPEIQCSSSGTHRLGSYSRLRITVLAWLARGAAAHGGESDGRW